MSNKTFKIILFIGIVIAILVNIVPAFGLYNMSEDDLVTWSYFWIAPITYGVTGLLVYKKSLENGKDINLIPIIATCSAIILLWVFLNVIFPML